jgi:hypothetical protein
MVTPSTVKPGYDRGYVESANLSHPIRVMRVGPPCDTAEVPASRCRIAFLTGDLQCSARARWPALSLLAGLDRGSAAVDRDDGAVDEGGAF